MLPYFVWFFLIPWCYLLHYLVRFRVMVSDGAAELAGKSFTPLHVHNDYLIHPGNDVKEENVQPVGLPRNNPPVTTDKLERKGDLLIHELCQKGTDIIYGMRVLNSDPPLLLEQVTREVSSDGEEGEEEELSGVLSLAKSSLLPVSPVGGWPPWHGGRGYA